MTFQVFVSLMTRRKMILQTLLHLSFKHLTVLEARESFTETLAAMKLGL